MSQYDTIVVGAGHNGLVAAAYLAREDKRVLVLEKRTKVGGCLELEELEEGFKVSPATPYGQPLRPAVIKELGITTSVPVHRAYDPGVLSLNKGLPPLALWRDSSRAAGELRKIVSVNDATAYVEFEAFLDRVVKAVEELIDIAPVAPGSKEVLGLVDLANLGLKTRMLGSEDLHRIMRISTMSLRDLLDEWFSSDRLKAAIAAQALDGHHYGPYSPGTAAILVYSRLGGAAGMYKGGLGTLTEMLAGVVTESGGQINCEAEVEAVITENGRAAGVRLIDGREFRAAQVISTVAPQTTMGWVDPTELVPSQRRVLRNIQSRGTTLLINLALSSMPEIPDVKPEMLKGRIEFVTSLEDLEKASDAPKYGVFPEEPWVSAWFPSQMAPDLAPKDKAVMQLMVRWAPYHLKEGRWAKPEALVKKVLKLVEEHIPGLGKLIEAQRVVTPVDLEEGWGLPQGHIFQCERNLHQLFFGRPAMGWSQYETPISDLFLGGAGTHPGSTTTGASGRLAAVAALERGSPGNRQKLKKAKGALRSPVGAGLAAAAGLGLLGAGLAAKKIFTSKKNGKAADVDVETEEN